MFFSRMFCAISTKERLHGGLGSKPCIFRPSPPGPFTLPLVLRSRRSFCARPQHSARANTGYCARSPESRAGWNFFLANTRTAPLATRGTQRNWSLRAAPGVASAVSNSSIRQIRVLTNSRPGTPQENWIDHIQYNSSISLYTFSYSRADVYKRVLTRESARKCAHVLGQSVNATSTASRHTASKRRHRCTQVGIRLVRLSQGFAEFPHAVAW
jgi:hypothetical protein